uniref:Uncharacterized protein n=1 Tax=Anguilla anguilla TaxID=7936 RepID=A0A0E9VED3_ANGAN
MADVAYLPSLFMTPCCKGQLIYKD